jgi:hypothetical protein
MIALYQVHQGPEVLDAMIYFADQMLGPPQRLATRRTPCYTGKLELCWPNKDPGRSTATAAPSRGDVLGHITSVALEIV